MWITGIRDSTTSSGRRVYLSGRIKSFRFITSDGAVKEDPSIKIYMEPLSALCWIEILLVSIVMSLLLGYCDLSGRCCKKVDSTSGAGTIKIIGITFSVNIT